MQSFLVSKFQHGLARAQILIAHASLNELFLASEADALPLSPVAPRELRTI